jgi:20S proteasome subunit alpha 5
MFLTRSEYDRGVNTYSPEGRLFQVEYAIEAVKLGSTSIGLRTKEGLVFAAEKRIPSKLMVADAVAVEKISLVDKHIAVAYSGVIADSRTLVDKAQLTSRDYWFRYNRPIKVEDVTQQVANMALQFGDDDAKSSMARPYGVAMLFGGCDQEGAHLLHMDPSGTYIKCLAKAIGAAADGAEQTLKELYHENMTLVEGQKCLLGILRQVMEESLTSSNCEMAVVTPVKPEKDGDFHGTFHRLSKAEIDTILATL